ncbi:hypothetical protein [Paraburkholderia fungorum]
MLRLLARDDLLAAHRVPPLLIGLVPSNTGGFEAADTTAEVFGANEIEPLRRRFTQINEWIGEQVVRFNPYSIKRTPHKRHFDCDGLFPSSTVQSAFYKSVAQLCDSRASDG